MTKKNEREKKEIKRRHAEDIQESNDIRPTIQIDEIQQQEKENGNGY